MTWCFHFIEQRPRPQALTHAFWLSKTDAPPFGILKLTHQQFSKHSHVHTQQKVEHCIFTGRMAFDIQKQIVEHCIHIDNWQKCSTLITTDMLKANTGSHPAQVHNHQQLWCKYRFTPAQVHTQHRFTPTNNYDANICSTGSPRCMISPENGILMVAARRMCNIQ